MADIENLEEPGDEIANLSDDDDNVIFDESINEVEPRNLYIEILDDQDEDIDFSDSDGNEDDYISFGTLNMENTPDNEVEPNENF